MDIRSGNLVVRSNNDQHLTKTNKQISPTPSSARPRGHLANGVEPLIRTPATGVGIFFFFGACVANEFGDEPRVPARASRSVSKRALLFPSAGSGAGAEERSGGGGVLVDTDG